MQKWIVGVLCICWTLMARGQSKEYFEQAAKSYQQVYDKTKCQARKTWALEWIKYCNCVVNVYATGGTPNCPKPSSDAPPCPADAGQGSGDVGGSSQGGLTESAAGSGSFGDPGGAGGLGVSGEIGQYLNPYLQQLYQQYTGSAPNMSNLIAVSKNYSWTEYAGISRNTLNGLTTAATNLYSTLGKYDEETAARLSITSSVGSIVSIAGGLNAKDASTVQAFSQGIGLLWDAFAKSAAKRRAEQERLEAEAAEQQRLAAEREKAAAMERAKREYEERLMAAKGEFLNALEKKTFTISYAGAERKAIFVWFPKHSLVTVQHFYISNMITIQPYSDGSFPLKDEMIRLYSKSLPAYLRNSDTLRCAVIYPIGNEQDFQLKFLALLKATENLALMPVMANVAAPVHDEANGDTDFWGNPVQKKTTAPATTSRGTPVTKTPAVKARPDSVSKPKTTVAQPASKPPVTPPASKKKDDFWNN